MDNIISPELTALMDKYSPFFRELRKRLVFTLVFFVAATIGGFIFYEDIIGFLITYLSLEGVNIVFTSPFQFINLAISCGMATGLITIIPLIIFQIMSFLRPALKRKEFRLIVKFIPYSIFLFVIGFIFGVIIMKWQIEIFLERSIALQIGNILDITGLLSTVLLTAVLMGVGFQFPILLLLLLRLGIVSSKQLSAQRRWVYLGSFMFALLLPPDSILADVILSLPLIILFEITMLMNSVLEGTHRAQPFLSRFTLKRKKDKSGEERVELVSTKA